MRCVENCFEVDLEILKIAKSLEGDDRDQFQSAFGERQRTVGVGILLALLLGGFGAHSFYLQQNKKAVWLLVGTFVGFCTAFIFIGWIPLIAVTVICIIDAVNMGTLVKAYNLKLAEDLRKEINYMKD